MLEGVRNWRSPLVFVVSCSVAFFLLAALVLSLRDPYGMEARAGLFVRAILNGHGLVCPILYERPYPDYPPLFFLLESLVCSLNSDVTALCLALPSLMSASLLILLVFKSAKRYLGEKEALVASAILFATPFFWFSAQRATVDMLLGLLVYCANISFFAGLCDTEGGRVRPGMVALGLAFMAGAYWVKGPIGIALSTASCAIFLTVRRRWRKLAVFLLVVMLASSGLIFFHYQLLLGQGGNTLAMKVLDAQFLGRFGGRPNKPFYYYFVFLTLTFSPFLLGMLAFFLKRGRRNLVKCKECLGGKGDFRLFVTIFFATCVLPFLFASSRHGRYLLPAFAPLAVVLSCPITKILEALESASWVRAIRVVRGLYLMGLVSVSTLWFFDPLESRVPIWAIGLWFTCALGLFIASQRVRVKEGFTFFVSLCVTLFVLTTGLTLVTEPGLSRRESGRQFVAATEGSVKVSKGVYLIGLKWDGDGLKYSLFSRYYPQGIHLIRRLQDLESAPWGSIVVLYERDLEGFIKRFNVSNYSVISRGLIHAKGVVSIFLPPRAS